ncbi:deoxythymidylate kinase (predicted), isoform CRA_c [Rattus norvegicus]|uniref:Deoxythymidylate kinase (Predicted), isoform CRA_c n=1 Tax=Rattus norvegicus TaxID=10116 RepID=A6JR38_RAT|nr:deoxythymidylate kinase (predicted), isoform CRA_c [Rattus norvegicus]
MSGSGSLQSSVLHFQPEEKDQQKSASF